MNTGRTFFFKKVKSLTGLSPVEFIRTLRIRHAASLMEEGELTMAQISFKVGFADPRYFSKIFKLIMGVTATEYRDSHFRNGPQP
ncbi:MAG: helix-turn-helix transcriptional regulator [Prevotellaceae bacterium]|nr:helix-turn-helix transcriptional regulator [Prevotellaceae bacterium]